MNLRSSLALKALLLSAPLVVGAAWLRADLEQRTLAESLREIALDRMENGDRERCEASPETYPRGAQELFSWQAPRLGPRRPGPPNREMGERRPRDRRRPGARLDDPFDPGPPRERESRPGPPQLRDPNEGPRVQVFAYDAAFASANPGVPPFPLELRARLEDGSPTAHQEIRRNGHYFFVVALNTEWADGPCANLLATRHSPDPVFRPASHLWSAFLAAMAVLAAMLVCVGPLVARVRRLTGEVRRAADDRYATPVQVTGTDELGELAQAFNDTGAEVQHYVDETERRERTLRAFVENTTHDVALPLTVLQGHLSRMRDRVTAEQSIEPSAVHESIEEAHYIASILRNLGAVAQLEAGAEALERHPVDLSALVERVVTRHRALAEQAGIRLEHSVPEEPVTIRADVTLLEQAASNVIHNAVRYNRAGGHVAAVLSVPAGTPDGFSLRVLDDGPGIPDETLGQLSQRSFRGDEARTRHPDGHGLGLAITRDVMDQHGFELRLGRSEFGGLEVELYSAGSS